MNNEILLSLLFENQDKEYKLFNDKIINTKLNTIGIRIPILKKIANDILKGDYISFLNEVKNEYYEQVMIEGLIITKIKNYNELIKRLDIFINKIDNWAICDTIISNCKIIKQHLDEAFFFVKNNIKSKNPWRVRVCFVILLNYFVNEKYLDEIFKLVEEDKNDFYYVLMSKAWLLSICYIKFPYKTLNYLKKSKLDYITYNKTISKICDSKRVSNEDKKMLRNMKKKSKNA